MEVKNDLPLPAYYSMCDDLIDRINKLQYLRHNPVEDNFDELRNKIEKIKKILVEDNKERINEDIEKLLEVVKKRVIVSGVRV